MPTKTSDLSNDSGYITNEALNSYATKAELPTKVSQLENDSEYITALGAPVQSVNGKTGDVTIEVGGNVDSVNGKTGAVVLSAADIGALPNTTVIPDKTSQLDNDSGFITSAPVTSVNTKIGAVTLSAADVSAIPSTLTGTAGQVLTKTADGQEWKDVDIPNALPNPNALTFTGAVTGSYDGSEPLTVNIPSSGGGGGSSGGSGKAKSQILIDQEITELTASLSVTLEHDFHNLTAIINCGSAGAALTAGSDGTAVASKIGLLIDTTSFGNNPRKVAQINTSTGMWKTMMCGAEWADDLSVFKRGFTVEIATGTNSQYNFLCGGPTAMYGTVETVDNVPRTGKTANIVVNGAYLNVGTRVVLWGEYYE